LAFPNHSSAPNRGATRLMRYPSLMAHEGTPHPPEALLAAKGRRLAYFTIAWNSLEGLASVAAGAFAGSISLVGFGIDSFIEVASGSAVLWRFFGRTAGAHRERIALRIIGACFLSLAVYLTYESAHTLLKRESPERSIPGIAIACVSLVAMPLLSRAKKRVGMQLGSRAMHADAVQTDFCVWLSAILLVGLLLNALFGWWWADPVAALLMVPLIAKEGIDCLRGETCDTC
jgi:divalent metal cation (Fe/Co/Zn/Cd) transporter